MEHPKELFLPQTQKEGDRQYLHISLQHVNPVVETLNGLQKMTTL